MALVPATVAAERVEGRSGAPTAVPPRPSPMLSGRIIVREPMPSGPAHRAEHVEWWLLLPSRSKTLPAPPGANGNGRRLLRIHPVNS